MLWLSMKQISSKFKNGCKQSLVTGLQQWQRGCNKNNSSNLTRWVMSALYEATRIVSPSENAYLVATFKHFFIQQLSFISADLSN